MSPPQAEVRRVGRWTYHVQVVDGLTTWGPDGYGWHVLGRRRALSKARRVLARYLRNEARRADLTVVVAADLLDSAEAR